jgi:cytosine permease
MNIALMSDQVFGNAGSHVVKLVLTVSDYARFVRRPVRARIASALALGVAYPLVLTFTALPAARCGAPNLIAAMVGAGIGIPALALLALGALIDGGASLYSGSLSLTNEVRRFRFPWVIIVAAGVGLTLAMLHAESYYLSFLSGLGVMLPPVGTIIVLHMLVVWRAEVPVGANPPSSLHRLPAIVAWVCGTSVGYLGMTGRVTTTGIGAIDSMGTAALVWSFARGFRRVFRLAASLSS